MGLKRQIQVALHITAYCVQEQSEPMKQAGLAHVACMRSWVVFDEVVSPQSSKSATIGAICAYLISTYMYMYTCIIEAADKVCKPWHQCCRF